MSEDNRTRLFPGRDNEWPSRAGWYRFSLGTVTEPCRAAIWFDFGRGFIRYHSIDLGNSPGCFDDWIVRLFKPPKAIELRISGCRKAPDLRLEKISRWRAIWSVLSEWLSVAVKLGRFSSFNRDIHHARPLRKWRARGLQAFRESQPRHVNAYDRWRAQYVAVLSVAVPASLPLDEWLLVADFRDVAEADDERFSLIDRALNAGFALNVIVSEHLAMQWQESHPLPGVVSFTEVDPGQLSVADHLNGLLLNKAIKWLIFLPAGVELFDNALLAFRAAGSRRHAAVVYSDSELSGGNIDRRSPMFRHRFSPERLLSHDWLGALLAINMEYARKTGGWREAEAKWSQYELCLRIAASEPADAFVHIPHILYSEKGAKGLSVPAMVDETRYQQARRSCVPAKAFGLDPAGEAIAHKPFAELTTVIIATRDRVDLLRVAVESVLGRSSIRPNEIIIVDNGSTDNSTLRWLAEVETKEPEIRVLRDSDDFNYSRLNNLAASYARGSILAFLNNDTEVLSPDWMEICGAFAMHPYIGAVGPLLLYPNGTIQHAGLVTGVGGVAGHVFAGIDPCDCRWPELPMVTRGVSAVTGACLVIEKRKFEQAGGFDEKNLRVALNDVDLCLRLEEVSFRNVFVPCVQLVHKEMQSRRRDRYEENSSFSKEFDFMRKKWGARLDRDPWCPAPLRFVRGVPELFWAPDNWEAFVGRKH